MIGTLLTVVLLAAFKMLFLKVFDLTPSPAQEEQQLSAKTWQRRLGE